MNVGYILAKQKPESTTECLYEGFFNPYFLVKREQEVHESRELRACMRVFLTLMSWPNENKSNMRVDES